MMVHHRKTPIAINDPEEGWYEVVLVKGGRPLGAKIWWDYGEREACAACEGTGFDDNVWEGEDVCDLCYECDGVGDFLVSDDVLRATLDGEVVSATQIWPKVAGKPIDMWRYTFLILDSEYLKKHEPNNPEADPTNVIPFNRTRMPY